MRTNHAHPKDCPDQKAAAADRKRHAEVLAERQRRQQVLAHAEWLDWLPAPTEIRRDLIPTNPESNDRLGQRRDQFT